MSGPLPRFAAIMMLAVAANSSLLADLNPEAGAFLFQKHPPKEYAGNPQNWTVVQDSRGVIYVGNTDGVLEFDGITWRRIAVRSGVRALAIDAKGTLFVGGRGVFGYLAGDENGVARFVSLLDKVPPTERSFNDILDVLPTAEGVYFVSHRRLFIFTPDGKVRSYLPSDRFGRGFTDKGKFFVTSSDRGLLTMQGGSLVQSHSGDVKIARGTPVFAPGRVPLLAAARKLFRLTSTALDPFPTAADEYFKVHNIYSLCQLPGGDIAVGTNNGGLVLLNQKGELERILHTRDGLPSEWVTAIYSDREHGIWVATDNGLTRAVSALSSFGEMQGLRGNVYAIGRLEGALYAGTSLGLFRMRTVAGGEPVFDPVTEVQEPVFAIAESGGLSVVGSQRGVYLLSRGRFDHILTSYIVYDIGFSQRDPEILYAAGGEGIHVLRRSGKKWTVLANERGRGQEFRTVVEDRDGEVWGTTSGGVWRIDFAKRPASAEQFNASNGVPSGWVNAYLFRGHVVFASERGLLRFNQKTRRFEADAELGGQFADGTRSVSLLREDNRRKVWLTGKGYHGILNGQSWFPQPLLQSGIDEMFALALDADGTAWASGASGVLFRHRPPSARKDDFGVLLRSVVVTNDNRTLVGGDGAVSQKLRLPYRDNALRFEFGAPFFDDPAAVQYQFRLDGSEKKWSEWTLETRKDYTNLPEGRYQFRVRARNPHDVVSSEMSFRFSMLPPWYRTWWAYAFYVTAFLLAGWLILQWRLQALHARNKWLEHVVEERTAEVRSERDQNEALLLNILPKPVASELRTTGSVKPTAFEDVTVCFSDFVGFTLSSEKLPAEELISSLNDYFTAFDDIIGRYGLEKLKTIGDAYMFAGGLPDASPSHAVDAVLAALEMVEVAGRLAQPEKGVNWSIRLGLYSGPVVAGVVGVRKFAFDIWGNTVNFASRMESAGSANRVNLSETTCSRVSEFIDCEPRGPVRIKEGREMEMYFALQVKAELLTGPLVDGIPQAFRERYEKAFSKPPKGFPHFNGHHNG